MASDANDLKPSLGWETGNEQQLEEVTAELKFELLIYIGRYTLGVNFKFKFTDFLKSIG